MFPSAISITIPTRPVAKTVVALIVVLLFSSWGKLPDNKNLQDRAGLAAFRIATTRHTITLQGKQLTYQATTGYQSLNSNDGKAVAEVFYTAYTLPGEEHQKRPVTFLFNGGPGSASIWLHMGGLGPVRVNEKGIAGNNPDSWLAFTDLVFIDPVGTGYSRTEDNVSSRQFNGYHEDIDAIAAFTKQYIADHHLQESPKFVAGESYGALRAIGLADELEQKDNIKFSGITLISPAINYQLISFSQGNETAYPYYLPSYSLSAQYHHRLSPELEKLSTEELLHKASQFAQGSYQLFLNEGDSASEQFKHQVIDSLGYYTGLSVHELQNLNGRVTDDAFTKGLFQDDVNTVGTFDSRLYGARNNGDPSVAVVRGPYTKAFARYITDFLGYQNKLPYLSTIAIPDWNYGTEANNSYMDATVILKKVMTRNPTLKIQVAAGYYDLATPIGTTTYVFHHLNISPELLGNITVNYYSAGHMIYTGDQANARFSDNSQIFYRHTLGITKY